MSMTSLVDYNIDLLNATMEAVRRECERHDFEAFNMDPKELAEYSWSIDYDRSDFVNEMIMFNCSTEHSMNFHWIVYAWISDWDPANTYRGNQEDGSTRHTLRGIAVWVEGDFVEIPIINRNIGWDKPKD